MARMRGTLVWATMVIVVAAAQGGCGAPGPVNPSFELTPAEARAALARMAEEPVELERPVVVLDGWMNPGLASLHLGPALVRHTGDRRVVAVTFLGAGSFEQCMERVIEKVDAVFEHDAGDEGLRDGDSAPDRTVAVDVVAFSMGGLVARYANLPAAERAAIAAGGGDNEASAESNEQGGGGAVPKRRLNVVRMFTISTPHRGALRADNAPRPPWGGLVTQMRGDSPLIERLEATVDDVDYAIYPYVRLGDRMVGEATAAPTGVPPWWVPRTGWLSLSHTAAYKDPRIVADILARLRGEAPFATEPPAPLPESAVVPESAAGR